MTTVEVVQVPVYVSLDGKAVGGLAQSDFALYVNGKRQDVAYFDVIDFAALAPAAATSDPRQRRMYLLTFDLLFSTPNSIQRAQKAAEVYLDHASPGDVFAVAKYTSNHGFEFIVPFTRDRALAQAAIGSLSSSASGDPLQLTLAAAAQPPLVDSARTGISPSPDVDMRSNYTVQQAAREAALQPKRFLVDDQVEALTHVADRMAQLEGQKHVVLFSAGFDASLVHGTESSAGHNPWWTAPQAKLSPYQQVSWPAPIVSSAGDPRLSGQLRALAKRYTAAGVFLDAIDIVGLRPWQTAADNEALFTLTRDTGGTVIEHENNLTHAVQTLADRQRIAYVLGFKPSAGGRKTSSIRVEVPNAPRGADVVYRPSYSTEVPVASASDGLRLADILLNDIPQNGLSLQAATSNYGGKTTIDVDIATREVLALGEVKSEGKNLEAEALIYIYSGQSVVAFQQKHIAIEAGKVDAGKPIRVTQQFELPNGAYAVKVLVRYDDQIGFVRRDFTVQ
jgi:VWFA-related protein